MSSVLDEHRQYLADTARMAAFQAAIDEVVRPGDVVVDLGCGTGVLGLFACRAGAARVYGLEATNMIGMAREICRANGFSDRVTYVKEFSHWAELPELADVVVADQIGRFGFEAGVFSYFADARQRLLKPGGVTVPSRIDLVVTPVETAAMWSRLDFWETSPAGFDVRPGRSIAANTGYPVKYAPSDLLGDPVRLAALDPTVPVREAVRADVVVEVTRDGTMHGIGGWFEAQMSPNVTMTNSPLAGDARIDRHNVFLPIDEPIAVATGDRVSISMQIMPAEVMLAWEVAVLNGGDDSKASFRHSTFNGMLVCKEDLQLTRPDFTPRRTLRGDARLDVLTLCDGTRPLAEVEDELWARYPGLFPERAQAAVFVSEVVSRYTT